MTLGRVAAITDAGRKRRRNEDAFVCEAPLFAVADGMGGAQAGEIASRLAAAALRGSEAAEPSSGEERVVSLIREANRRVYERAAKDEAVSGMGTTMTAALLEDSRVWIGHVGDSRAYLIRGRTLEQLTEDHSLVAELVRSGKLSPEEAEIHPQRSVITRALGTEAEVDVDAFSVEAKPGDLFMLCSDGLTSMVDDETILALAEQHRGDLDASARALVAEANRAGGEDNITVVLFEVVGEGVDELDETVEVVVPAEPGEEATLTELDAVPTVEPAASAGEPAPAAVVVPARRRRVRGAVLVLAAALLVAAAGLALLGLSRSHFVGAQPNGHVAVYQGVPWRIVVRLYRVRYESPLLTAHLSQTERRELFDHDLQSYDSALGEVLRFERDVVP